MRSAYEQALADVEDDGRRRPNVARLASVMKSNAVGVERVAPGRATEHKPVSSGLLNDWRSLAAERFPAMSNEAKRSAISSLLLGQP